MVLVAEGAAAGADVTIVISCLNEAETAGGGTILRGLPWTYCRIGSRLLTGLIWRAFCFRAEAALRVGGREDGP